MPENFRKIALALPGLNPDSSMITKFFNGPIKRGDDGDTRDRLQISFGTRKVRATFRIYYFMDHHHHMAYLPSLQLTGYGDSRKEAVDMLFDIVLDDFCENLLDLPVEKANEFLSKLGWNRDKLFKRRFTTKSFVDPQGILRNFNLPLETKIESEVVMSA